MARKEGKLHNFCTNIEHSNTTIQIVEETKSKDFFFFFKLILNVLFHKLKYVRLRRKSAIPCLFHVMCKLCNHNMSVLTMEVQGLTLHPELMYLHSMDEKSLHRSSTGMFCSHTMQHPPQPMLTYSAQALFSAWSCVLPRLRT